MKNISTQALSAPTRRGHRIGENRLKSWWGKSLLMALVLFELILLYPHSGLAQSKMYWVDYGTDKIQRANLDGTSVEDLVTTGLDSPTGIALDVAAGKIYWTDVDEDKIQRANLDGTGVEDLVTTGLLEPYAIALDVAAGKMYWTDYGNQKIQRANLDGTSVEDVVTGLSEPRGIALDIAAGKMYWTDFGNNRIQRANLDGTGVEDLVTTGPSVPFGIALDVAAGKMYWTDAFPDKIQRANLDGTGVEDLVTTGLRDPRGIALDVAAGKIYWTDGVFNIKRANLDGTGVEDLVTGLNFLNGIALDVSSTAGNEPVFVAGNFVNLNGHKPSEGNIHSNGSIQFKKGKATTYTGNLWAVEDVIIHAKNTVNGDVTAGQDVIVQSGATVNGTIQENASVAPMPLPNPSFTAGGANHWVRQNLALPPGSYGTVLLGKNAKLDLSSGDYYFNTLNIGMKGLLSIDASNGAVNINVVCKLDFNKEARVQISSGDDDSEEVTFATLQESRLTIGDKARVLGTIIASNAAVTLAKNSRFQGKLYAKEILVSPGAVFQPHGSATALPNLASGDDLEDVEEEVSESASPLITDYALAQNYPNPFNPTTVISFQLPVNSEVSLSIYNINGQLVKKLVNGEFASGRHQVTWDATDDRGLRVASGVYFYMIKAGSFTAQRKLVLMK